MPGERAADAPVTIKFDDSVKTDLKLTDASGLSLHNLKDENGNLTNQYVVQNGGKSYAATVAA
ncbi:flagellin FliC, partial [Escherichia coli]|nr:flagellin FliC [Escherichia coli]